MKKKGRIPVGRVVRNVLLWAAILFLSHGMSMEEDAIHHYGFKGSPWYWRVLLGGLALQIVLVYVNNLFLVPRFLAARRRLAYGVSLTILLLLVSICFTLGYRAASQHINISKMELVGMPNVATAPAGSWTAFREEIQSYFLGNLIWVSLFTMAWYMNDHSRQRKAAELAHQQQSETELAFLQSQLAPHFLFNTLNNIYALTLRESGAGPEAMLKLSAILRSLLYERGDALVPFEKEAALIQAYTDLEMLRQKDADHMRFEVRADRDYRIPPLLWLPILENIFKHGTRVISDQMFVDFSCIAENGSLLIRSRNYCKDESGDVVQHGIGLQNLQRRLTLLYTGRHTFRAGCHQNIYAAEVTIQLT